MRLRTPADFVLAFKRKYPLREVDTIYAANEHEVLIEAPDKNSETDENIPNAFIMTDMGVIRKVYPNADLEAYSKLHDPKRIIYERTY